MKRLAVLVLAFILSIRSAPPLGRPLRGLASLGEYLVGLTRIEGMKKTSRSCLAEAVGIALEKTRREEVHRALACQVSFSLKLPTFQRRLLCRYCKLTLPHSTLRCGDRGGCPPMSVLPFCCRRSFHSRFAV